MTQICGKQLKYVGHGLGIGKQLKYFGNGLDAWGTAEVFEVWHKYVAKDLNISNMPYMCSKQIKYLRNGFTMWKMI